MAGSNLQKQLSLYSKLKAGSEVLSLAVVVES